MVERLEEFWACAAWIGQWEDYCEGLADVEDGVGEESTAAGEFGGT